MPEKPLTIATYAAGASLAAITLLCCRRLPACQTCAYISYEKRTGACSMDQKFMMWTLKG